MGATALTAMTTPIRSYVGELLAQMGLRPGVHDLAAVSGAGQTIRVTSGVDDGWVVILSLRAEPGSMNQDHPAVWTFGDMTATDATGRRLANLGWQGNGANGGDEVLAMFRRPPGGAVVGSPVTLHVQPDTVSGSPAPGPGWTLRFAVPASAPPVPRALPAAGRVADVSVTFTDVRASDRYIVVVIDATGPDDHDIGMVLGLTALTDPRGAHVPNMHGAGLPAESTPSGLREREELYWPHQGSGTYHLVVGPYRGQRLDRDLVIQ